MTRRIFRYTVPVDGEAHAIELTGDPVAVAANRNADPGCYGYVEFWAEHDTAHQARRRWYQAFGTGHVLPDGARHVGTCARVDGFIWHLYELRGPAVPEAAR